MVRDGDTVQAARGNLGTEFQRSSRYSRDEILWGGITTEIPAWEEDHVARIIRRYVGRGAATRELIAAINRAEKRA